MDKTGGTKCLFERSVFPQRVNCMEGAKNGQGPTPGVRLREVSVL